MILKILLALFLIRAVLRRKLITEGRLIQLLAGWGLIWLFVTVSLYWSLPGTITLWYEIASAVALALPFSRLTVAPLALHANRHR